MQINKPIIGKVFIKDLLIRCHIGINEEEQRNEQDIIINIELTGNLGDGIATDNLSKTVDYLPVYHHILELGKHSRFSLIETLGNAIADYSLAFNPKVQQVIVGVEKPHRFNFINSVGIQILRQRE